MTNVTRDILIYTGKTGMVWIDARSGYTGLKGTYIPARIVKIYYVYGVCKSIHYMYERLIM